MSEKEIVSMEYQGAEYTGEVSGGVPHGRGKIVFEDKSTYEGEWSDGVPHGYGKARYYDEDGEYLGDFEGEYCDGELKHGKWRERNLDYEGDFVDSLYEGYGVSKWDCGLHYYKGEWKEGVYHGKGLRCDYDGTWDGEWKDGCINGNGIFTSKEGWVFTGKVVESDEADEFEGNGMIAFGNGDIYVGGVATTFSSLSYLKMHGKGKYTYSDGSVYEGEFVYGRRKEDVEAEKKAKIEEEERQERERQEEQRREEEERTKDPVAYDLAKKKAYRKRLEKDCAVLFGGATDIRTRFSILKEAYFQANNSGFNDHMAWEASTGRDDSQIEFWENACRLKREVNALCNIYKEELGE